MHCQRNSFQSKLTISTTSSRHVGLEGTQKQDLFEIQNINWNSYKRNYTKSSNECYIYVVSNIVVHVSKSYNSTVNIRSLYIRVLIANLWWIESLSLNSSNTDNTDIEISYWFKRPLCRYSFSPFTNSCFFALLHIFKPFTFFNRYLFPKLLLLKSLLIVCIEITIKLTLKSKIQL